MKIGKLPENNLVKSVYKRLKKQDMVLIGPEIGNDYGQIKDMILADGVAADPGIAWIKAVNNFVVSGGKAVAARITIELSQGDKDSWLRNYMDSFNELSVNSGIPIIGGNTETVEGLKKALFIVTIMGIASDYKADKKGIEADYDILMAGYAGAYGANVLVNDYGDRLSDRFNMAFLNSAMTENAKFDISGAVNITLSNNSIPLYMHDISAGGVYRALCELGEWTGKGFSVENKLIPIRQETIELCEHLDINPYMIDGTGACLMVVKRGRELADKLIRAGYVAAIIGKITGTGLRQVVLSKDEVRTLSPSDGDDLLKLL